MSSVFHVTLIIGIIAICAVFPVLLSRRRSKIIWWDYAYPFLGALLWFILKSFDVGGKISMSNFLIEMFLILLVSIAVPWLRFAMTFAKAGIFSAISFFLTFLPIAVTIGLRLTVPLLPE